MIAWAYGESNSLHRLGHFGRVVKFPDARPRGRCVTPSSPCPFPTEKCGKGAYPKR